MNNTTSESSNPADLALVPPLINTNPLPDYDYDRLDYGMTIGIERTPKGRLWACWVGGGDNEKAFFVLATSDDQGDSWSKPRLVINPHDDALPYPRRTIVGNLWTDPLGRLWLFFDQSMTYFDGRAGNWFTRCDNPDAEEPQWSAPVRIWHGVSLNKPIVLTNGDWMAPVSLWNKIEVPQHLRDNSPTLFNSFFQELDDFRGAHVFVSPDQGATWVRRGRVVFPNPQFDEHNLVQRNDGSIWMTARTSTGDIMESISRDGGETWSEPQNSGLRHAASRHFMRRLKSGNLLLIKHGATTEYPPERLDRSHLSAFISEDDGATWKGSLLLDERNGVSYPDGTQAPDGTIFISYDYNRDTNGQVLLARFTEADILAGRCITPSSRLRTIISQPNILAVAKRLAKEGKLEAK